MNFIHRNFFLAIFFIFFLFDGALLASEFINIPFFTDTIAQMLQSNAVFMPAFPLVQITILSLFAYAVYITPVRLLKKEIAFFLGGSKNGSELRSTNLNPDIRFIINFFNKSLEILRSFKEEFKTGQILRSEVELASEIQKHILKKRIATVPSLDIVADTKSATEVGGDSYDIIAQGNNYYIYLGDVTGHGVASGFVMMVVNALISGFVKIVESSADVLVKTNEILKPRIKSNMLMSLLMVRWNEQEKKMYMTGAGHEYLMVYKASQKKTFKIKSGGVALGMAKDISRVLKEIQIGIDIGDIIVMYTDGITEARNGKNANSLMFGVDRLITTIDHAPIKTAQGVFNNITIELSKFMGYQHHQFDDITLICVHYKGLGAVPNNIGPEISREFITEWSWRDA